MQLKNRLLYALLSPIRHALPLHPQEKKRRILAVATTALGDTLWATPALESLRRSFSDAYLAVLTSPIGGEVLKHNPWIDRLYLLKEPLLLRFLSYAKQLYREKFDTVLLFHASQRLVLPLCSLLGARNLIGTSGQQKGLDDLLTHPLPPLFQHEITRRLQMVETMGGKIFSETLSFFLKPEERKTASLAPGRWVALHPGSKDRFKRWPAKNFAAVGRVLQKERGCQILITGTPSERALMEEVAADLPGAHLADPNLPLRSFAALLEKVDLLISNDTGPVHLACALGRPVIALYASTDPRLCGPYRAKHAIALSKRPTCTPCLKRKCQAPFCFLQIGPCEVTELALQQLRETL